MQTLHAGCSKAEPNIFAPPQTPFVGAQDGLTLISWRWPLPSPTDPVWWRSMHAIFSYCGNRSTHTQTHTNKQTHRQDRLQYTVLLSLARSVINDKDIQMWITYPVLWNPKADASHKGNISSSSSLSRSTSEPFVVPICDPGFSDLHSVDSHKVLASSWTLLSQTLQGRPSGLLQLAIGYLPS